jgi:hypothetical protein
MWVAWSLVQKMIAMTPVLESIAMAIKDTNSIHAEQVKFLQDRMEQRLDRHEDLLEGISKDTMMPASANITRAANEKVTALNTRS